MTDVNITHANQVINTNELSQIYHGSQTPFSALTTARLQYLAKDHKRELSKLNLKSWLNIFSVLAFVSIIILMGSTFFIAQQVTTTTHSRGFFNSH